MRPRTLEEFVGQEHILGPGRLLRRAIQADQLSSLIFYGPPGTGKTTLARVIANTTRSHFVSINAVLAGVKEIRRATEEAQQRQALYGRRTILFVDEVHRWNKAQQDALLPWVENGTIVFIGATIENPYFEVNRALVSRSRIFQLRPLGHEDLRLIARRCLQDPERGYGGLAVEIDAEALEHLVDVAGGDARTLLNALELALETTPRARGADGREAVNISLEVAEESIQRRVVLYDKEGDYHFDTISAFIKSLRGSDPDAVLYWLAKMVYAGEDPCFIFRRMLIFACEDVGLADPNALAVIEAAAAAFDRVGLPEGRFHLAHAALYLATAPKSNSSLGFFDALETVEKEQEGEVPDHLKDASRDREGFGHGEGYLYPHAYREHWVAQQYLPDRLQGRVFYQPGEIGYEAHLRTEVLRRREAQLEAMLEREREAAGEGPARGGRREDWLERAMGSSAGQLALIRERVLAGAALARNHLVLDLRAGGGLLTWEALRRVAEGGVWSLAATEEEARALSQQAESLPPMERPVVLSGGFQGLGSLLDPEKEEIRFDAAVGWSVFARQMDRLKELEAVAGLLKAGARLSLAEPVAGRGTRLSQLLDGEDARRELLEHFRQAEEALYGDLREGRLGFEEKDFEQACGKAGLKVLESRVEMLEARRRLSPLDVERWFSPGGKKERPGYAQALKGVLKPEEVEEIARLLGRLAGREVTWRRAVYFLVATR